MEGHKKSRKTGFFSTASLFFICTCGTFILVYFHTLRDKTFISHPVFSNIMFVTMNILTIFWLVMKFPLFIKPFEELDESFYEKIYIKEIGFLPNLYSIFFQWTKINHCLSLFSRNTLKLGIKGRTCKFCYYENPVNFRHRILDIVFTIISSVIAFFLVKEFNKFSAVFGIVISILTILFSFRKTILNYIFSVNINEDEGYKINVMYPYSHIDEIFSSNYGFASYIDNIILIHKDVFFGGDILKKYVLAHEKGHLKTVNRIQNSWMLFVFIIMSFIGISGGGFIVEFGIKSTNLVILPLLSYVIFLSFYIPITRTITNNNEVLADIYAIQIIGKRAVLEGLQMIKDESNSNFSRARIIDRRIEIVREYEGK